VDTILCFKHERVVSKDNTVRLGQVVLQVLPGPNRLGYSKATVAIHESLDRRFSVHFEGRQLPSKLIPLRKLLAPKPLPRPATTPPGPIVLVSPPPARPAPAHPWRRYPAVTKSLST
jgi:hypothetical protein